MENLIDIENVWVRGILFLHVLSGTLSLSIGMLLSVLRKGNRLHKILGRVYVTGMSLVFITAFVRSLQTQNHFLFAVGLFSISMTLSGWLAIQQRQGIVIFQKGVGVFALLSGIFLIGLAFFNFYTFQFHFSPVPVVFGLISFWMGFEELRKPAFPEVYRVRLRYHITRLGGSLIAAFTAFLVVNIQMEMYWIPWLLPTVVGSVMISFGVRKYVGISKSE